MKKYTWKDWLSDVARLRQRLKGNRLQGAYAEARRRVFGFSRCRRRPGYGRGMFGTAHRQPGTRRGTRLRLLPWDPASAYDVPIHFLHAARRRRVLAA